MAEPWTLTCIILLCSIRRSLLLLATTIGSTNYSCLLDDGTLIYGSLIRITLTAWLSANESYDGYETCFVSIIGIARIVWFIYFGLFGLLTRITYLVYLVYFLGLRTRIIWFTYVVYLDTLHGLLDYFGIMMNGGLFLSFFYGTTYSKMNNNKQWER
ncbi:hypothetical protein BC941DRAFT_4530 [Chlamydoabsidia padenii]|nr:hypothetical protein BC941DRAFT_3359 [Chlamydoabsidia padenii]KAI8344110.1 hypothetical protein BC941DRAFT_4530 [Chlamydoabsidia padenii]